MPHVTITEQIYHSPFKPEETGVFRGHIGQRPVIVKRGNERLAREAAVLQAVSAPQVPELIDYTVTATGLHEIVMSRLSGVTLANRIALDNAWNSTPLNIPESVRILRGIARAFSAVRAAGYHYRDVNLHHVIVSPTRVGLCDHEAAAIITPHGTATVDTLLGTWETMAPEEFDVGNVITEAAATYSLGTIALQLITGKSPFAVPGNEEAANTERRIQAKERHGTLPEIKVDDVSVQLFLARALSPAPADRYQTIDDFITSLENLAGK